MDVSVVRVPVVRFPISRGGRGRGRGHGRDMCEYDVRVYSKYRRDIADISVAGDPSITPLSPGIHSDLLSDRLIVADSGRINIVAKSVALVPCTYAYVSKFGILVNDGKSISLITEVRSFPKAVPLADGLMIAPIIVRDCQIIKLFDVSLGELLVVVSGKLVFTYLLSDIGCKLVFEDGGISYVNDDIALHCGERGVFALDLHKPDRAYFASEIQPHAYIPSPAGIKYAAKVAGVPPAAGDAYQIVSITRRAPELCVACAMSGPLVRAALECGHIARTHERCADAIIKCICGKSTDRAIVLRD